VIQDKVIIITGASQGLGKELSMQLSKLGGKIALVSRTEKDLKEVKETIVLNNGIAEYFVCDITDRDQISDTVNKIKNHFGNYLRLIRPRQEDNGTRRNTFEINL